MEKKRFEQKIMIKDIETWTRFSPFLLCLLLLILGVAIAVLAICRSNKLADVLEHYCCDRADAKSLRQRSHVLQEMLQSEMNYVDGLEFVAKNFVQPLIKAGDKETADNVFNSWLPITKLHQDFLEKMKLCCIDMNNVKATSTTSTVTATRLVSKEFSQLAPFLRLYIPFVEKYNCALSRISHDIRSNGSIAQRIDVTTMLEDIAQRKLFAGGLSPLLALPFQRLCKYGLLLRELSKTFGEGWTGAACREAMSQVDKIVLRVNAAKARSESGERFLEIATALSEDKKRMELEIPKLLREPLSRGALLQPSRRLLYEGGGAARVCERPLPMETSFYFSKSIEGVYFVLFSDLLMIVRRVMPTKWKEEKMTLLYCIELQSLEMEEDFVEVEKEKEKVRKGEVNTIIDTVLRWRRPIPWSQLAIGIAWKDDGSKVAFRETLRIALKGSKK